MLSVFICALLSAASGVAGLSISKRSVSGTAQVFLTNDTGEAQNLASGLLYGIPLDEDQIPSKYFTEINFRYSRAGGTQIEGHGWLGGIDAYKARFESVLSNYKLTRKYGGTFILLATDVYGIDNSQPSTTVYPGDDGDWSTYDNFLTHLISDIKENNMIDHLYFDIWNEGDLTWSWPRPRSQLWDLWGRTYHRLRKDLPEMAITGPSHSAEPSTSNSWWTEWAAFIAKNDSVPEQYAWHMETGGGDMQSAVAAYHEVLSSNGLPTDASLNINEYAVADEQVPAGSAWWISQLERVNAWGVRGIWQPAYNVNDLMGWLISKPNPTGSEYNATAGGYFPAAEWWVYNYYANMTGTRVATTPTADLHGDIFAVKGSDMVRLLVGSRITTGFFNVEVNGLGAVGLPPTGSLKVRRMAFTGSDDHYAGISSPTVLDPETYSYTDGKVVISINQTDIYTAHALEFDY